MNSSKPIIGMVSCDAPPHIGGMGRHVGELTEGLRKEGMDVRLFDRTQRPMFWKLGRHIGCSIGLGPVLRKWISQNNISLLHLHAGPGGLLLPSGVGIPLVVTVHHTYRQQSALPGETWKRLIVPFERKTYQAADRLICLSDDTRSSLVADYGIPSGKISVIPGGFDLQPWIAADQDSRDRYACVFVGRQEQRKGFDLLEAAWPLVQKEIPNAKLVTAGRHHRMSDVDLRKLLGSARVLVCPSRFEGFGLAAAEAIAAGTPVVATNVPGLRSVVSKKTGLLVSLNADSIAAGILHILRDDHLWNQLHRGCRGERGRFSRHTAVMAHRALYNLLYS